VAGRGDPDNPKRLFINWIASALRASQRQARWIATVLRASQRTPTLVIATADEVWRVAIQKIKRLLYDWIASALRASQRRPCTELSSATRRDDVSLSQ